MEMGVQQILAPAPAPVIMLGTQPQIVSTLFWPKYTDYKCIAWFG